MNRTSMMRVATMMVTALVAIGALGLIRTQTSASALESLSRAATMASGSLITRFYMDLPGASPGLGEALIASKKAGGAADAIDPHNAPVAEGGVSSGGFAAENGTAQTVAAAEPGPENPDAFPGAAEQDEQDDESSVAAAPASAPDANKTPARKIAFIYHSHNRESWLPELKSKGKTDPNQAFDADVNVTMLGARLQKKLEELGVGAIHSEKDYNTAVKSFNYNYSYSYSKTTVKEALAVHDDLIYLLDIHRDSARHKQTTIEIDGKAYAKLYFIVGKGNPNWKENEALAERIHKAMETRLPGVSKGILTKGSKHGHGEYNQSLSNGSVLIEIGGVDNSLEESNRTIDALARVIAELAKGAVLAEGDAAVDSGGAAKA